MLLPRLACLLALLAVTACAGPGPAESIASPGSPAPACPSGGSVQDQSSADPLALSSLVGASMRLGRHDCYERFVFEMTGAGAEPGWRVGYRSPLTAQGSGDPVELAGTVDLEIVVGVWTVTDFEGRPAQWPPFAGPASVVTDDFAAIREARMMYAFEGITQIGLGLDAQRPFHASWLADPPRLVVDVATG